MTADLSTIPLVALSVETRHVISTLLNPPKVIPSENGLPRDWRGLAHLSNLAGELMPLLTSHSDPSGHILTELTEKGQGVTVKDLQSILEKIDRWDVLDDAQTLFEKDAQSYAERVERSKTSAEVIEKNDVQVLTVDDLYRLRQGLQSQYYDAFLLYADEDREFARETVEKLEGQYNLKLCLKDRDLIGGVTFEHEAVMTLISERCNRLIVIVSPNFLRSSANKFFLNFAQALSIDKRQRKIVPCLFQKCQLPPQLSYMFVLDYNRVGLYDFWGKLRDSVQVPSVQQNFNCATMSDVKEQSIEATASSTSPESQTINRNLRNDKSISEGTNETKDFQEHTSNLKATNINEKKGTKLLQWTRKRWNWKTENSKSENYQPISESLTTGSLPSLSSLDPLNSSDGLNKTERKGFIDKCMKKVQLKKVLVKS